MVITINAGSPVPIYSQLKRQIILAIVDNDLEEGYQLPSVRQLAGDLDINMHTVNKAYKLLANDGFIQISKKKGAFVALDYDLLRVTYSANGLIEDLALYLKLYKRIYGSLGPIRQLIDNLEVDHDR